MQELYPVFLRAGYTPDLFWELSFCEVIDLIEAHENKVRLEFKKDAIIATNLARNIGEYIALAAAGKDSKVTITPPWDLYPGLFTEEKEASEQMVEEAAWEEYKAKRAGFVQRYNESFKAKEVKMDEQCNDSSGTTGSPDSEIE